MPGTCRFRTGSDPEASHHDGDIGEGDVDEYNDWDIVSGVGVTALLVAAGRAMESKRDDALIDDPYAESFVTRSGTTVPMPTSWTTIDDSENRSETDKQWANFWMTTADYLGVRSRFFDEYFLDASTAGVRQVVILAAGLDTRAFRLSWPPHVELFEIDQPKVLEFKDSVLEEQGAVAGCARHIVPIDLRADWPEALLRANFDPQRPTAWLAEGLLLYLPGTAVETLFTHVHRLSAAGSWFATEQTDPDIHSKAREPVYQAIGRRLGLNITTLWIDDDQPDPGQWFHDHGWQVTAISRAQAADRYGRTLRTFAGDTRTSTLFTVRLP
jgi:methyltransferase (TIGR00027 family)